MRPSTSFPGHSKIDKGVPKRVNTCSTNTWPLLRLPCFEAEMLRPTSCTNNHVIIQICPLSLFGLGLVRSIYHRSYGVPATTGFNGPCFVSFPRWYLVHSGHLRPKRSVSSFHPDQ